MTKELNIDLSSPRTYKIFDNAGDIRAANDFLVNKYNEIVGGNGELNLEAITDFIWNAIVLPPKTDDSKNINVTADEMQFANMLYAWMKPRYILTKRKEIFAKELLDIVSTLRILTLTIEAYNKEKDLEDSKDSKKLKKIDRVNSHISILLSDIYALTNIVDDTLNDDNEYNREKQKFIRKAARQILSQIPYDDNTTYLQFICANLDKINYMKKHVSVNYSGINRALFLSTTKKDIAENLKWLKLKETD
ncbi:MAG: hypothetical protein JW841_07355 [Deltaproteobacteria bacterium]|nr:hypothetical protein [Deltaproteobacteria bacterium]